MVSLYPNQLDAALKQGFPVVLLLWGDDAGALVQASQRAVAAYGVDPADPFASEKIDAADLIRAPSRLTDSAATPSLMGGKRLIQVSGIAGTETGILATTLTSTLIESVEAILDLRLADVLVIIRIPQLLDAKSPLVKAVQEASNGLSVRFFLPSQRDISGWIQTELRASGKPIEPDALSLLTDHLGADMEQTKREVEKLLLYVGDDHPISTEHVRASLSGAIPHDVFRLAEAVGGRNIAQVDRLIQLMHEEGEDLNGAFVMTVRHLSTLKAAQNLRKAGEPDDALLLQSGKGRAPTSVKSEFLRQVKTYPASRLAHLTSYTVDTLTAARSGTLDESLVFSRALLALAV